MFKTFRVLTTAALAMLFPVSCAHQNARDFRGTPSWRATSSSYDIPLIDGKPKNVAVVPDAPAPIDGEEAERRLEVERRFFLAPVPGPRPRPSWVERVVGACVGVPLWFVAQAR